MNNEAIQNKICQMCGCELPAATADGKLNFHPVVGAGGAVIYVCTSCKTTRCGSRTGESTSPFSPVGIRRSGGGFFR